MWWRDVEMLASRVRDALSEVANRIEPTALVEPGAILDESAGPIALGAGTRVCAGAVLRGPMVIGADCLIGNQVVLRGPIAMGDGVRIGYSAEIKHARIRDRVAIGPMCFVADSIVDDDAYLGAMVRTSNHRLDRRPITVRDGEQEVHTGLEKLGCWIGARAALGIQVIVLPGRVIEPGSLFEPRVTITRNYPAGRYRVQQTVERVEMAAS